MSRSLSISLLLGVFGAMLMCPVFWFGIIDKSFEDFMRWGFWAVCYLPVVIISIVLAFKQTGVWRYVCVVGGLLYFLAWILLLLTPGIL